MLMATISGGNHVRRIALESLSANRFNVALVVAGSHISHDGHDGCTFLSAVANLFNGVFIKYLIFVLLI